MARRAPSGRTTSCERASRDLPRASGEGGGYVAEKAEAASGWLFPVGDEMAELGYVDMFSDMFDALDEAAAMETFYDGYIVNAVMDACFRSAASKRWEPVELEVWRGGGAEAHRAYEPMRHDGKLVIKEEKMPDGRVKLILKDETSGAFEDVVVSA